MEVPGARRRAKGRNSLRVFAGLIALLGVAASACAPAPSGAAPPRTTEEAKTAAKERELDLPTVNVVPSPPASSPNADGKAKDKKLDLSEPIEIQRRAEEATARADAEKRAQEAQQEREEQRDAERHIQQAHGASDSDEVLIERVVTSHASNVQKCYDDLLAKSPASEGTVKVRVAIDVSGRVRDAKIVATTIDSPALSTCILHEVSTWTFPKLAEGAASITYPYVFSKS